MTLLDNYFKSSFSKIDDITYCDVIYFCIASASLLDVFPQLRILVLRNIHESDVNDLVPYLPIISSIEKLILNNCPLNQASTLICEHLFNSSMTTLLTSCILHSANQKDGILIREPISSLYQSHCSLVYLRVDVYDLTSLKHLLMFLPELSTLGKINY